MSPTASARHGGRTGTDSRDAESELDRAILRIFTTNASRNRTG